MSIDPDGHGNEFVSPGRQWPCDGFYGDMDGTWTPNGSGLYTLSSFPSGGVELAVGRVDLYDMSAYSASEASLTSAYIQRAHAFRMTTFVPLRRGVVYDNLATHGPLSGGGWRSLAPLVGNTSTSPNPYYDAGNPSTTTFPTSGIYQAWPQSFAMRFYVDLDHVTSESSLMNGEGSFLWTYGSGGGTDNSANQVGSTSNYATSGYKFGGAFNMCYGSYFGRWNTANNFLRAPLGSGHALINVWSGSPNWFFHNMGMGEPVARSVVQSMNNTGAVTRYRPQDGWGGPVTTAAPNAHMALMGDPTLRMIAVEPPTAVQIGYNVGNTSLSWTQPADVNARNYYVYKFDANGIPVLLNSSSITATTYNSSVPWVVGQQFMVRCTKLETTSSGSYWNLSMGALATTSAASSVQLACKVFLGGPYNSGAGTMGDALRTVTAFPLTEPYTGLAAPVPVGGGGETTTAPVLAVTGNNAIVDWVLVELRSSSTPATVVFSRPALVQRDGDVVGVDGTSAVGFPVLVGSYYVAIRHRNHLGCMTSSAQSLSGTPLTVDFTLTTTPTYGTDAQKTVSGKQVLWQGNVEPDTQLKYTGANNDRDPILVAVGGSVPTAVLTNTYNKADVTMDGIVKYTGADNDRDPILVNVGGSIPTATRTQQLP
jgi:hypothetical protein